MRDAFPPYCPEAERGVLGCCLLDSTKTIEALKAGANPRWFFTATTSPLGVTVRRVARPGKALLTGQRLP